LNKVFSPKFTTNSADSLLDLYFRETRKTALLTAQDEEILYSQMEQGRKTGNAELERQARDALVKGNLALVVSVAKHYQNRGLDFQDLIQEGNLGLLLAVGKFRYSPENRFATYAVYWIRSSITHAIANQARAVRLPEYLVRLTARQKQAEQRLTQELGRKPSYEGLAADLKVEVKKVRLVDEASPMALSLSTPLEYGDTLGDTIEDHNAADPLQNISQHQSAVDIREALGLLNERERFIIRRRYGIDGFTPSTLETLAKKLEISRQRIMQLEAAALRKIRSSGWGDRLKEHLEMAA
jgi:RNA polymerase primary sigma factor